MKLQASIVGGGVIGGGWVARFLLNGWNVKVFDPDIKSQEKINQVLKNARHSLPALYNYNLPKEGNLNFCDSLEEAVFDSQWIQESIPERLDLKHKILDEITKFADENAIIGSSTSGFKPSKLNQNGSRVIVAHPFNPVYLLPLVELVGDSKQTEKASEILRKIGMYPLIVRKEIDAHIADRLLEAVWRESLWLVKDGVATTSEIDEAIRMAFGIRWAQMGLFETYRIAGGETGMKHFLAQFGPALKWPWTKLMDVPKFNDELVDLIAKQSDKQSGMHTILELERIRDNNLVGIIRALKYHNWGAGEVFNQHDKKLKSKLAKNVDEVEDLSKPIITLARVIPPDWADFNGHMNEAKYLEAFSSATDFFMTLIGCNDDYIKNGKSYFTAETHLCHIDETFVGRNIFVSTQLLLGEAKKLHLFHRMYENAKLLATAESFLLHVDLTTRKTCNVSDDIARVLQKITKAQVNLSYPEQAGNSIRKTVT